MDVKINNDAWEEEFPGMKVCRKDDTHVYMANGAYELLGGATKCAPDDPEVPENNPWSFDHKV